MAEVEQFEIVLEEMTLEEIELLEEEFDLAFGEFIPLFFSERRRSKHISFIYWLMRRRTDPEFTREEARKAELGSVRFNFRTDDALDPTSEESDAGEAGSTS